MLTWILELPIWPTGNGRLVERIYERATRDSISVESWRSGAIKRALNESGWLEDEVIAAGQLRQGKAPSTVALLTGLALIELLRPRRSKSLPSTFVLAVTADRVVAFKAGGGGDSDSNYETRIKPGERGSWPRELVRLLDLPKGVKSMGGTLELGGQERIPVARSNMNSDPSTDELMYLLGS
jgi:hypothetical protein